MEKLKLLEKPHPHPLTFIEGRTNNGEEDMLCCECNEALYPPAFICSDCKFYIHQSCIDCPDQIRSRFHPHHPLFRAKINCDHCYCCWQKPRDSIYICEEPNCDFIIDIKCAIADTKQSGVNQMADQAYQHFSHPHPLILEREISSCKMKLVVCHLCEQLVVSGSTYFCRRCDIRFHQDCAELRREISHPDHPRHPLFLFPYRTLQSFCNRCKNRCPLFVYSCVQCNFNLHVTCLSSSHHEHDFTRLRNSIWFRCLLCGWESDDFPWFCSTCHLLAHKECAELPSSFEFVGHDCLLNFTYSHPPVEGHNNLACEICRKMVEPQCAAYSCFKCSYVIHLSCARQKMMEEDGIVSPFNSIDIQDGTLAIDILHSNCEHKLILSNEESSTDNDKHCHGCMLPILAATPSYNCESCDFFLHKDCADLPKTKRHLLHRHPLTLIAIATQDVIFQCDACLQFCHGYAYHCEECRYTLDIRCALTPTRKLEHPSHQHFLSLAQNIDGQKCHGCGQSNKTVFECDIGCSNFSLDYRCATLPLQARCRFDTHYLDLTFGAEDETGEYYCDVCEAERNRSVCFYYCKMCRFAAHPECIFGEYPWLKYGFYETHRHPLALVTKGNVNYSDCGHCGKPCAGNLAYECRRCKFNVHAIGQCYHKQILQGKITFKK